MKQGDRVRHKGSDRIGRATHVADGLVDVDFQNGDWSVTPERMLEVVPPVSKKQMALTEHFPEKT